MPTKIERQEAIDQLKRYLKPGTTVYTILRHVASSGMTRWIDLYVFENNEPRRLTWNACLSTGYTYDRKREALKIGGCGMDMGFAVVYDLSKTVLGDATALNHRWM